MLESLEEFADTIGGPAWRRGRAAMTSMSRSITLYLDEDYELFPPDERPDYCDGESEEIEVSFTAFREPNEESGELFNTYKLTYETSLPLGMHHDAIPEPFASQLVAAIAAEKEAQEEERRENLNTAASEDAATPGAFVETNMVEYTINSEDGTIDHLQTIDYRYGDIPVSGAAYDSSMEGEPVHHAAKDGHAEEYMVAKTDITEDSVRDIGERILIAHDLEVVVTDPAMNLEIVGHSSEENARRVLAILSLMGCNIRRYRPHYKE
jgi:hypothetical protein